MTARDRAVALRAVFERAAATGKRVYGFSSSRPSCELIERGQVPDDFDRVCVEGDATWAELPASPPLGRPEE